MTEGTPVNPDELLHRFLALDKTAPGAERELAELVAAADMLVSEMIVERRAAELDGNGHRLAVLELALRARAADVSAPAAFLISYAAAAHWVGQSEECFLDWWRERLPEGDIDRVAFERAADELREAGVWPWSETVWRKD